MIRSLNQFESWSRDHNEVLERFNRGTKACEIHFLILTNEREPLPQYNGTYRIVIGTPAPYYQLLLNLTQFIDTGDTEVYFFLSYSQAHFPFPVRIIN